MLILLLGDRNRCTGSTALDELLQRALTAYSYNIYNCHTSNAQICEALRFSFQASPYLLRKVTVVKLTCNNSLQKY